MTQEEKKPGKMKPGKLMALTLLLTVPVMMSGCGSLSDDDDCDPQFDDCDYDSSTGHYYYKGKKNSSSGVVSSGSAVKSHNGFGSGGSGGSGG